MIAAKWVIVTVITVIIIIELMKMTGAMLARTKNVSTTITIINNTSNGRYHL